jgi:multidrug efflux system membrane fusion protein
LVVAAAVVGLCVWLAVGRETSPAAAVTPPVSVSTARVAYTDVPVAVTALGAAQAWQGVVIRAQVNGRLQRVSVQEGAEVKAGDLIAEIDPAPYQALLLQAQGALERDRAQLRLDRLMLKRYKRLAAQNSIALEQVDTEQALVEALEGTVLADQGAVDLAQVNLNYCRITSPVAGRVGVRLIDAGNLVSTTDTGGIVTINQLEPIAVTFSVPQGDFQRLLEASDGFRRALRTQAFSQDTGALLGSGELTVADNHVDDSSGTVALKARFANEDRKLWPGQFVNVRLTLRVLHHALTIPNAAVNHGPDQMFAYVVGADHRVRVSPISVTEVQGAQAIIGTGLQPGEAVVTDGQVSLKPGSAVIVRNVIPTRSGGAANEPARSAYPPNQ